MDPKYSIIKGLPCMYCNVPKFSDRLFAIPSAWFKCITPWKNHISQILG